MNKTLARIDSGFGLVDALTVDKGDIVSLVGAGGKTTVLYALSMELRRRGLVVVATSTTHMQMPVTAATAPPLVVVEEEDNWLTTLKHRLSRYGSATLVERRDRSDKLKGVDPVTLEPLRSLCDCIVIEADGARRRSFKAPAGHEPVVPEETTVSVVIVGLDALGQPLDGEHVHRLEQVKALVDDDVDVVTEDVIATCIVEGYFPRLPRSSRKIAFLNKASGALLKAAESIGERLVALGVTEVVFGEALKPHECFYRMRPDPGK